MNIETAKILCDINRTFYRDNAGSFSATRTSAWPGWNRCVEALEDTLSNERGIFSVFDLACGNLRFETFFRQALPGLETVFYAVDDCDGLVPSMSGVHYRHLDILATLLNGSTLREQVAAPLCDLSVAFGFLHHVPTRSCRERVLASLVRQTCPGGHVIVSFWQFLNNDTMAEKARATHVRAMEDLGLPSLDDNDFLLGWKNSPGVYRYCHSFSDDEVDRLADSVAEDAVPVDRFTADGRTGDLNSYLILRVR